MPKLPCDESFIISSITNINDVLIKFRRAVCLLPRTERAYDRLHMSQPCSFTHSFCSTAAAASIEPPSRVLVVHNNNGVSNFMCNIAALSPYIQYLHLLFQLQSTHISCVLLCTELFVCTHKATHLQKANKILLEGGFLLLKASNNFF